MGAVQAGRQDQHQVLTARGRARLTLAVMGLTTAAGWQAAVALTTDVPATDLGTTLQAAVALEPVVGLPGRHPDPSALALVWAGCTLTLGVALLALVLGWVFWRARRRVGKGIARGKQVSRSVGEDRLRRDAEQTMPSLTAHDRARAPVEQLGFVLARDHGSGQPIVLGYNEALSVIGVSGGGKTTSVMGPAALEATGPVVLTSNEVGVLDLVAATRSRLGRVWVFDPLDRACWPDPMVYDPVAGCRDGQVALARGTAFVAGCGADGRDATNAGFFRYNAKIAMRVLLHAAALDGRTIDDVLAWVPKVRSGAHTARDIITDTDDPMVERSWEAQLEAVATGADETVASTLTTLAQVVDPLTLNAIRRWTVPRAGAPVFDADEFVRSTDTLVLISDDSTSTNIGPLCTMVFQEVVDAVKAYAPFTPHGRLEPPMRIIGDEIANIAPIEKLPEMATELRKLGVQIILAFQSEEQLRTRWGRERGRILLEQMAAELVLPGVKNIETLTRYSDLAGVTEVLEQTINTDAAGERSGVGGAVHERKVLRGDEIRQMSDGQGLLIWRNAPAMRVDLRPWYQRDYHKRVERDLDATRQARTDERRRRDAGARRPGAANREGAA